MHALTLPALGALSLLSILPLQDQGTVTDASAATTDQVDAKGRALEAVRLLGSVAYQIEGDVSRKQPDREDEMVGGMMMAAPVILGGDGGFGDEERVPFDGEFTGYRYDGGKDLIVLSKSRLPGFRAWLGKKRIIETRSVGPALNVSRALQEIRSLLDTSKMETYAKKAEWTAKVQEGEPVHLTAALDGKWLRKTSPFGDMGFGWGDEVLRVEVDLEVDAENWVTSASFAIVRNDPMAAMRIMEEEMEEDEDGGMAVAFDFNPDDIEPVDGEVTTWNLKYIESAPSKSVREFREEMSAHLDGKDF